jgi:hypothetical protein
MSVAAPNVSANTKQKRKLAAVMMETNFFRSIRSNKKPGSYLAPGHQ